MPKKISVSKNAKYRIKKTIRDVNAPMGTDYTAERRIAADLWEPLGPACYHQDDAINILRLKKAQDDVKVEYIYPEL
jgi:hypothetical protein